MHVFKIAAEEALHDSARFDTLIDARSESEFAEDHMPGAVNWPSLNNEERHLIGTEYKQVSPFAAQKRGAMMVARNIASHIEREVMDKQKDWAPLVYCWRGGKRSGALATVLGEIGFRVRVLDGGYRAYRRAVIGALETLPQLLSWRVVCGPTGAGKSRLLQVLRAQGAQVLDLETLANHRGSVLGLAPGTVQPGQKRFESLLWDGLRGFDAARPVYVESESPKVGDLRLPLSLVETMRASPCVVLGLALPARVSLLMHDYAFFVDDVEAFCGRLDALRALRGKEVVQGWQDAARGGRVEQAVHDLLASHYDPLYARSMKRNFGNATEPRLTTEWHGDEASLQDAARAIIAAG